jgi:hypothetical protein
MGISYVYQKGYGFRVHVAFDLSVYDLGEAGELVYTVAVLPIISRSLG